eukprot:363516-Chlamydomonas_euryale.AAC.12
MCDDSARTLDAHRRCCLAAAAARPADDHVASGVLPPLQRPLLSKRLEPRLHPARQEPSLNVRLWHEAGRKGAGCLSAHDSGDACTPRGMSTNST